MYYPKYDVFMTDINKTDPPYFLNATLRIEDPYRNNTLGNRNFFNCSLKLNISSLIQQTPL